jgi:hypothetical protein
MKPNKLHHEASEFKEISEFTNFINLLSLLKKRSGLIATP